MPRRGSSGYGYSYDYYDYGYFPPSQPIEVKGGIKAQSQRGTFGTSWWAKRWIAVLESFDIGARLSRGRSYARKGQVVSIEIAKGLVTARVQGSRPTPYSVRIEVKTLTPAQWQQVAQVIASEAVYAARMLNGEMPQDIENAFTSAQVSLFPTHLSDLTTSCSCPDWSNPCKHIAAVYYLIGEEFDRDPFLLFKLRGLDRDELLPQLGSQPTAEPTQEEPPEPLPGDSGVFWHGQPLPEGGLDVPRTPPVAAALPRRLGRFPFWRGTQPLLDAVEPDYRTASDRAIALVAGDYAPPSAQ